MAPVAVRYGNVRTMLSAPQGDPVAAGLARGALDQPLDGVDALEAADAAIDVDRHGVGEGALER